MSPYHLLYKYIQKFLLQNQTPENRNIKTLHGNTTSKLRRYRTNCTEKEQFDHIKTQFKSQEQSGKTRYSNEIQ
jgi:hypothetical protein